MQAHAIQIILYPDANVNWESNIPSNSADVLPLIIAWCKSKGYQYAYILHDKDVDENGNLKKPHIHLIIRFKGTNSIDKFAREYRISGHMIQVIEDWTESVRYLVHMSKRSMGDTSKYKYPIPDINSNFDLATYFISDDLGQQEVEVVIQLIDYVLEYHASYYQLLKYASGIGAWSVLRKNFNIIDKVVQQSKNTYLRTTYDIG